MKDPKESDPPNYRIRTSVVCCYTCKFRHFGLERFMGCEFHYGYGDWLQDGKMHYGVSEIGLCDLFELRPGIGPKSEHSHADNLDEGWQDENRTETTNEQQLSVRLDCRPAQGGSPAILIEADAAQLINV